MSAPYILYGGGVTRSIAVQPLLEEAGLPYELRRVALRRHGRQDWKGHLPSRIARERQRSARSTHSSELQQTVAKGEPRIITAASGSAAFGDWIGTTGGPRARHLPIGVARVCVSFRHGPRFC